MRKYYGSKIPDSLYNFYEYLGSKKNLEYCIRINVEWNEESFVKMKQLAREVMKDYANEDYYPKRFICYFVRDIPRIISILSHFKICTEKELAAGYTQETYQSMIEERIEQLNELCKEFIDSL